MSGAHPGAGWIILYSSPIDKPNANALNTVNDVQPIQATIFFRTIEVVMDPLLCSEMKSVIAFTQSACKLPLSPPILCCTTGQQIQRGKEDADERYVAQIMSYCHSLCTASACNSVLTVESL